MTNDGLLSPGDYQRVLTTSLTGNLVQSALGTYGADLDLKRGIADRIDVSGTAALSGVVAINLLDPANTVQAAKPGTQDIVLLRAAGGASQLGLSLVAPNTAVMGYSLHYPNGTDVVLRSMLDFAPAGLVGGNQAAVAAAVNAIQTAQSSPRFGPIATALFFQPNATALGAAYDSLSGSATSGGQQASFAANDNFMASAGRQAAFWLSGDKIDTSGYSVTTGNAAGSQFEGYSGLGGPVAKLRTSQDVTQSPGTNRWRFWSMGFAGTASTAGNTAIGSAAFSQRGAGASAGVDFQTSPNVLVGFASGGGGYGFSSPGRATSGTSESVHISTYAAYRNGPFYISGTLAASIFDNEISRFAAIGGTTVQMSGGAFGIAGLAENLKGRFTSRAISGDFEAGFRLRAGAFEVTPFAGIQFSTLRSDAYGESLATGGESLLGLFYSGRVTKSLPTSVGLQIKADTDLASKMVLSSWARAAWRHEWTTDRSTESAFLAAPGFNFAVRGALPAENSLRTSIGARLTIDPKVSLFTSFDGDFSKSGSGYTGSAGVRIKL